MMTIEIGIDFVHAALQFDAVGATHLDIDQRGVPAFPASRSALHSRFRRRDFVTFFMKPLGQRIAHAEFVIHDQQFSL
jgi:hypothetical protein